MQQPDIENAFLDRLESAIKERESLLKANPIVLDSTEKAKIMANSLSYCAITNKPSGLSSRINPFKKRKNEEHIELLITSPSFNNSSNKLHNN